MGIWAISGLVVRRGGGKEMVWTRCAVKIAVPPFGAVVPGEVLSLSRNIHMACRLLSFLSHESKDHKGLSPGAEYPAKVSDSVHARTPNDTSLI